MSGKEIGQGGESARRSAFGSFVRSALLLSVGACGGLLAGSLLDAPRLLMHAWLGPVQSLEIESAGPKPADEVKLTEFYAIQAEPLPEVAAGARPPATEPTTRIETARDRSGSVVQVRAYSERAEAERLVAHLRDRGFDAFVSGTRPRSGPRLRVRVAPRGEEPVEALGQRLETLGYDTWITSE